ncbi:MAG: pyridoxamine 5'-phosphate oxidase [Ornithinimicrobium sp.]
MPLVDRVEYDGEGLSESQMAPTLLEQIDSWVDQAQARHRDHGDVPEPRALSVATVDAQGQPDVRTVLMRFLQPRGIAFLTNTSSAKGMQLAANQRLAASLTWPSMYRSIRFAGVAERVDDKDVRDYFIDRPWASRISAWASAQSRPTDSRETLEAAYQEYAERYPDTGDGGDVPVPPEWGGYWLLPHRVEFWAGRRNRLHDRLAFSRSSPGPLDAADGWTRQRLQP